MSKKVLAERHRRATFELFDQSEISLSRYIGNQRPVDEVEAVKSKLYAAFEKARESHSDYCEFLDDDEYKDEPAQLAALQKRVDIALFSAQDYIKANTVPPPPALAQVKLQQQAQQAPAAPGPKCKFQTQKPPLPKFFGKIIDYYPFKEEFQFLFKNCPTDDDKREALYILKTCLDINPKKWVEGESDYLEAWKCLDRRYGDPRQTSDALLAEISKIKPLGPNDPKINDIFHLLKKTRRILTHLKREHDLDNSTTLSIIEKRLHENDRISWARHQRKNEIEPNIENLLAWMDDEIWVREVAGSEIRISSKSAVHTTQVEEVANYCEPEDEKSDLELLEEAFGEAAVVAATGGYESAKPKQNQNAPLNPPIRKCWFCKEEPGHKVSNCSKFKQLEPNDRLKEIKTVRGCYFCLGIHRQPCKTTKIKCSKSAENGETCRFHHHELLHGADFLAINANQHAVVASSSTSENDEKAADLHTSNSVSGEAPTKLLPIITTQIGNTLTPKRKKNANILIDSASEITLIRDQKAKSLGLVGEQIDTIITPVGGQDFLYETYRYSLNVFDQNGKSHPIQAIGIPKLSKDVKKVDLTIQAKTFSIDPSRICRKEGPLDVLIGIDHIDFHSGETVVQGPFAYRETIIGPVIFGSIISKAQNNAVNTASVEVLWPVDLSDFWTTEQLGVAINDCCREKKRGQKILTVQEKQESEKLRQGARKIGNRWRFGLPWKRNPAELPDNYSQAYARLISTEIRLAKNPENAKMYSDQISALEEVGSARKLSSTEISEWKGPKHYITHHAVYRPDKVTHPCRVVFNSALKYLGHVLNEYLHKCGDHLNNLPGVLIRFRENFIVIIGDVSKMYHQVFTDPGTDTHTHRFLWRNFENRKPDVYVKQVLTFGDISSPAIANIAMDMTAQEYMETYPESCNIILECRYMDDIANSMKSSEEAELRTKEIDTILWSGHFKIKEWITNINVGSDDEVETKVLGIVWNRESDKISIAVNSPKNLEVKFSDLKNPNFDFTKRIALSALASPHDVFGIGSPVIIRGKIIMQELWLLKKDWDESLPREICQKWADWFRDLEELSEIKFDRCLTPKNAVGSPDLVTFADSSKIAFGSVSYVRWTLENGDFDTRFVMAKARVAPLRDLSLPRKELQACIIAARITDTIQVECRFKFRKIYHFTDSMIAIAWIQSESRLYEPYISTRVGEIQTKTDKANWYHISSGDNVADDLTRGLLPVQLYNRFEKGPDFLRAPEEQWPLTKKHTGTGTDMTDAALEFRVHVTAITTKVKIDGLEDYQPFTKVVKITACIMRFISNLKITVQRKSRRILRSSTDQRKSGPIGPEELNSAENLLIKMAQTELPTSYMKDYKTLSPFQDSTGIVRVGGRMTNSEVKYDQQHPVLLPYQHWLSKLIVLHVHRYGHPGVNSTAAKTRKRFWIIGISRMAKSVIFNCVFCRELRAEIETQYMADLPASRVTPAPPFLSTSVDLFGHFTVKISRNKNAKFWGVIFACLVTRAVYVDITADYSAPEFIQTFRRFQSFRGFPQLVISDRGSQLVGSSKEIKNWCANRRIKWEHTTATAAHHNGAVESLVKSTKRAIKLSVGDTKLTPLELQTVMFEAANLVNERPIGLTSSDPNDGSYIAPNDILLGRSSSTIPHGPFIENPTTRQRVDFCQSIITAFWKRWYRDVFPTLVPRKKWHSSNRNLEIDDYVLVHEPNPARGQWIKARITDTYPGTDGCVRSVKVRTATGSEYERPIVKIVCLLPVEEQ